MMKIKEFINKIERVKKGKQYEKNQDHWRQLFWKMG